jgi:copper chaperone
MLWDGRGRAGLARHFGPELWSVARVNRRPLRKDKPVIVFEVNDMSCGHCVSTITQALKAADPGAAVRVDLATHRVEVQAPAADAPRLGETIRAAGYTPVLVQA